MWALVKDQRRLLVVAVSCAALAAVLWSAALLLAFPITKVLMQQRGLSDYVIAEIDDTRRDMAKRQGRIDAYDLELSGLREADQDHGPEYVEHLRSRAREQEHLSQASRREWWLELTQLHVLPWLPRDSFGTLAVLLTALMVITGLHGGAVYLQEVWVGQVVQRSMRTLRARLFRQTLRIDSETLGREGTAAVMSRFTNDLTSIAQGMTLMGGKILLEPLKAGTCIALALVANWRLTLLSLVCAPLGAWLFSRFGKKLKKASRRQMETAARLYQVLQEALSTFRVVTAFRQQRHHRLKLYQENREFYRKAMQINRIDALANPSVELLGVLAGCLAILPGAYLVLRQKTTIWDIQLTSLEMDLASLALLYSLLAGVVDPARKLSSAFSRLKKAVAACERVTTWMAQQRPGHQTPGGVAPRMVRSLEWQNVTYAYPVEAAVGALRPPTERPAIDMVSLSVSLGDVVAVVGSNGSGKSTLAGLLLRFFDPQAGQVALDGVPISMYSLRSLRAQMAWVPQDPQLFDGSIAENIAVGAPQASPADIEAAARQAHILDFTAAWPQGLATTIGDSGNRLSGGQRQRIALARALVRDPAILILDEATAAIDAQSEMLIHEALRVGCERRTTLIITHSLTPTLLEFVTKVAFLHHGRLLAVGRHQDLLKTCPPYAALYQAQSTRRAA